MSDRELLELAAKAAGYVSWDWLAGSGILNVYDAEGRHAFFSPLADDGEAMRLAVNLDIRLTPYPIYSEPKHCVIASRKSLAPPEDDENTYVGPEVAEAYGGDPYAATRRAIVRAAAELGRSRA